VCVQVYFIAFQEDELLLMSYCQGIWDLKFLRTSISIENFHSFLQRTSLEFCPKIYFPLDFFNCISQNAMECKE
jgi:hypothetical protein